jgi:hypothetical protein
MSSIVNTNHIINRASEEYMNKEYQMTVQFNNLPITKSTLKKLRNDQSKDESKATLIEVKIEDMGATLLDIRIKQDIRSNLINYVTNELTLRITNNNAVNEAKEAERVANERARASTMQRQQAELTARLEATEARAMPRDVTRPVPRVAFAPLPRRARSRSPTRPNQAPRPQTPAVTAQPDSPTENLGEALNNMFVEESDEKHPTRVYLDKDNKSCILCSVDLTRDNISVLDCGHCFHFLCAHRAYRSDRQHRCPICRAVQMIVPRSCRASSSLLDKRLLDEVFPPSSS